jgi:hypothetical protein
MDQNGVKTDKGESNKSIDNQSPEDPNKSKRKRRSKNEVEGRSFVCECGKSYLSQPALTNHKKTKHETEQKGEKRGRGRPKKNVPTNNELIQKSEMKFKTFFMSEQRMRKPGENFELNQGIIERVFKELILTYKDFFLKPYNTLVDHPLLRLASESLNTNNHVGGEAKSSENTNPNQGGNNVNSSKKFDQIMLEYLQDCLKKSNEDYFVFTFKFVVLFRECINVLFNAENKSHKEYCEVNGAEVAPDKCNEFITEFMEKHNYFGMNSEDNKFEIIEIIQQFCFWLFENGYTSSRLSLVG